MKWVAYIAFLVLGYFSVSAQTIAASHVVGRIPLTNDWRFYALDNPTIDTFSTTIPGTVHTDLYEMGVIPDPFFGDNEQHLKWIEEETWVYETTLNLPEEVLNAKRIYLIFEGLDTYTDIYVNGLKLRSTDNMFRRWEISLTGNLHLADNQLRIVFHPAAEIAAQKAKELSYFLPSGEANFVRKAQYHFGWDWGPRFPTVGIWKPAYIEYYDAGKIEHVQIQQKELKQSQALMNVQVDMSGDKMGNYRLECNIPEIESRFSIIGGLFPRNGAFDFEIKNPKRWNCNGYGEPYLYTLNLELYLDNELIDQRSERFGLRTAELIQTPDSLGSSFYFSINDKPVYAKGANMIPLDVFLPRVQPEDYEQLIDQALDANFNMLRVWGGGVYEDDYFYDLCDEKGIMVWQDFMFACALYPGDSSFLSTVRYEIEEQVRRLRNHPSIVLWCGNNEIDEAWHNWGWQKQHGYSEEDSLRIYADYQRLFHELIPSVLAKEDPSRSYHPSSPTHGWGRAESYVSGDQHYWGVWWGMEPFERYREKVGRFASEFGFQSFPSTEYFSAFVEAGNQDLTSAEWKNHQKHPTGFETIAEYMQRDYLVPTNLDDYAYVSQLVQARGMQIAIEAQRTRQPFCMGSLYWQFNDCWPVVSWSSVDYFGVPKATHYAVKRAFEPLLLTVEEQNDSYAIHLVNDGASDEVNYLVIDWVNFEGTVLKTRHFLVQLSPNSSTILDVLPKNWISGGRRKKQKSLLRVTLRNNEKDLAESLYYFVPPKEMKLKSTPLQMKWLTPGVLEITASDYLAKDVYLTPLAGQFSDNYFDILPGSSRTIHVNYAPSAVMEVWMRENHFPSFSMLNAFTVKR
jgi:beta-mannosidase